MGGVFDLAHWFALAIVLTSVFVRANHWRWLLNANLAVSLGVALLGILQHYDIRTVDSLFWYLQPTRRVDITFGNPSYVGAYMLVNVLIALAFLTHSFGGTPAHAYSKQTWRRQIRRGRQQLGSEGKRFSVPLPMWRGFWTLSGALDLWVLTLSGTRGAAVGLLTGLLMAGAIYSMWGNRRKLRLVAKFLTATLLLLVIVTPISQNTSIVKNLAQSNLLTQRLYDAVSGDFDAYRLRLITARTGLEAISDAPIFGWGPENFAIAFDRHIDILDFSTESRLADQAHNKPVEELVTKGIVGFSLYMLLLSRVVWVLVRSIRRDPDQQLFVLFLGAALIGYVVQNLFLFDTPGVTLQFILLIGWVARYEALDMIKHSTVGREPLPDAARRQRATPDTEGFASLEKHLVDRRPSRGVWRGLSLFQAWLRGSGTVRKHMVIAVAIMVVTLTVASIYFLNYRPYRAAQIFPLTSTSLEQLVAQSQRSFQTFPPMATLGRQILFDTLYEHWERGDNTQHARLLNQLHAEGKAAVKSEPQNARIRIGLARLYQRVGNIDTAYVRLARGHLEVAQVLAPGILPTITASIAQEIAEEDYPEALTLVYSYIRLDLNLETHLGPFLSEAKKKLIEQIGQEEWDCRWQGEIDLSLDERRQILCNGRPASS